MIKVSIIIALYNGESYIARCLDSILSNKSSNIEIIVVNDGSTDSSLRICNSYAKNDLRIRVITKENGGVSSARNLGIKYARGEYIWFIDADDWIKKDSISYLLRMLNLYKPDIFQFQLQSKKTYDINDTEIAEGRIEKITDVWTSIFLNKTNLYACGGLIRKAIFIENEILFPVGRVFEDMDTVYKLLINSREIYVDKNVLYFYFNNPDSATHSLTEKKIRDLIDTLNDIERDFNRSILELKRSDLFDNYMLNNYMQVIVFLFKLDKSESRENTLLYCKRRLRKLEKKTSIFALKKYCSECQVSMFKHYILYKLGILETVIKILNMRK